MSLEMQTSREKKKKREKKNHFFYTFYAYVVSAVPFPDTDKARTLKLSHLALFMIVLSFHMKYISH